MIKYSEDFILEIKESFPDDEELINAIEQGDPKVFKILTDKVVYVHKLIDQWIIHYKEFLKSKDDQKSNLQSVIAYEDLPIGDCFE